MATLTITADRLHLHLTTAEKVVGLHGDVDVPLAAVRDVRVEPDALAAVSGLRAPGLSLPTRTKIGTWRGRGRRRFIVARRGMPAVRVALDGAGYDELLVSTPAAEDVARSLRTGSGALA
jgi:hypothetical protein